MATRRQIDLGQVWREHVFKLIHAARPNQHQVNTGIWQWVNSVLGRYAHGVGQAISDFAHAWIAWTHIAVPQDWAIIHAFDKVLVWVKNTWIKYIEQLITARLKVIVQMIRLQFYQLRRMIWASYRAATRYALALFQLEATRRRKADVALDHEIKTRIKWLHQHLEREASTAYKASWQAHLGLSGHVAELAAEYDPITRRLVRDLVKVLLDLAAVDDPLARLALGFLLRHVINKLGIGRVVGDLLERLMASILGNPRPHDLPGVIRDIGTRLDQLEQQWADFMRHGGPEVEQAGDQWRNMASPIIDAGLLAFAAFAWREPANWARDVNHVLGPIVDGTLIGAADLIKRG